MNAFTQLTLLSLAIILFATTTVRCYNLDDEDYVPPEPSRKFFDSALVEEKYDSLLLVCNLMDKKERDQLAGCDILYWMCLARYPEDERSEEVKAYCEKTTHVINALYSTHKQNHEKSFEEL